MSMRQIKEAAVGDPERKANAVARVLRIRKDGPSRQRMIIRDTDQKIPLYVVKMKLFRPRTLITISRASTRPSSTTDGPRVASASLHRFSRSIDMHFGTSTIPMRVAEESGKHALGFDSMIGPVTWKREGFFYELNLLDAKGNLLARFKHDFGTSLKRWGRIEIESGVQAQRLVDEIVISVVAMVEKQRPHPTTANPVPGAGRGIPIKEAAALHQMFR